MRLSDGDAESSRGTLPRRCRRGTSGRRWRSHRVDTALVGSIVRRFCESKRAVDCDHPHSRGQPAQRPAARRPRATAARCCALSSERIASGRGRRLTTEPPVSHHGLASRSIWYAVALDGDRLDAGAGLVSEPAHLRSPLELLARSPRDIEAPRGAPRHARASPRTAAAENASRSCTARSRSASALSARPLSAATDPRSRRTSARARWSRSGARAPRGLRRARRAAMVMNRRLRSPREQRRVSANRASEPQCCQASQTPSRPPKDIATPQGHRTVFARPEHRQITSSRCSSCTSRAPGPRRSWSGWCAARGRGQRRRVGGRRAGGRGRPMAASYHAARWLRKGICYRLVGGVHRRLLWSAGQGCRGQ